MRLSQSLLLALLLGLTCSAPALAETEAEFEARIKAVDEQIQQLASEVDSARSERQTLVKKMTAAEGLIQDRDSRIDSLLMDIKNYEKKLNNLEHTLQKSESYIATNKERLASMIRNAMQISANNGMQVMLQHNDPALASRLGVYYDYYFRASSREIHSATEQLEGVRNAHHEALKSRNWLQYLKKKATGQKQTYAGTRDASVKSLGLVDKTLEEKQRSVENLRQDQQRLTELLKELKKNTLGESGFFAASKGKYPWPAQGQLTATFGDIKSVGKLTWTGMFIKAARGGSVRAIADGEVVYADWLQGFGMLVIVDHGDGYMTLYGGNRELQVARGSWVETGATIATVGDSRGHKEPGVYFEIRHNAKPVNPELWVSAKNRFKTADN